MDLGFTAEEELFREEVRTWLDLNLPAEWRNGGVGGYREEADESNWSIVLRCPNCEWIHTGVFDQETVERCWHTLRSRRAIR